MRDRPDRNSGDAPSDVTPDAETPAMTDEALLNAEVDAGELEAFVRGVVSVPESALGPVRGSRKRSGRGRKGKRPGGP